MSKEAQLIDLTVEEWLKRYDAYIVANSDFEGSYTEKTDKEDALAWRDLGYKNDPEGAAHEEMSNWEPDEEFDSLGGERVELLRRAYTSAPLLYGWHASSEALDHYAEQGGE